jgi:hypothetical protein
MNEERLRVGIRVRGRERRRDLTTGYDAIGAQGERHSDAIVSPDRVSDGPVLLMVRRRMECGAHHDDHRDD